MIRFNRNIFSAKNAGETGGGIEITTSSIEKKINGNINYSGQFSELNARNPFHLSKPPLRKNNISAGIAFPIESKTSIYLNGNLFYEDLGNEVNATLLNSSLEPILFNQQFTSEYDQRGLSIELASERFKNHQILIKQNFEDDSRNGIDIGGLYLEERAISNEIRKWETIFSDTYTPKENFFVRSSLIGTFTRGNRGSLNDGIGLNVEGSFYSGSSNVDFTNKSNQIRFKTDAAWSADQLGIEFGGELYWQQYSENNASNLRGIYIFSGQNAPQLTPDFTPVVDNNGQILTENITSLESFRRNQRFQELGFSPEQIRSLGGGAAQLIISNRAQNIDFSQIEYSAYLQSNYQLRDNLALSAGIRYENQSNISDNLNFAPRIGVIWSPKRDKNQNALLSLPNISAGIGLFYSRFGSDQTANIRRINDSGAETFTIDDPNILNSFPNQISLDNLVQTDVPRDILTLSPSFRTPLSFVGQIDVGKLLPKKFRVSGSFTIAKRQRLTSTRNTTLAQSLPNESNERVLGIQSISKQDFARFRLTLNLPQPKSIKNFYSIVIYTFVKSKSDVVSGSGSPFDSSNFSREYSSDPNNGTHLFLYYLSLELPKKIGLNGSWWIKNGDKFNIITGRDTNGDGFYTEPVSYTHLTLPTTPYV